MDFAGGDDYETYDDQLKWEPGGLDVVEPEKPAVPDEPPSWGDYGTAVSAGLKETGAQLAAGARDYAERSGNGGAARFIQGFSKSLQKDLNESAQEDVEGLGETARKRLEAKLSDPNMYMHPFSSLALKAANMSPMVGATIIGGLVAGPVGAALVNGELTKDQVLNEIYKSIDLPDEELKARNYYYAAQREMGYTEEEAKADLQKKAMGLKPLIAAVVGAAAGAVGPGAIVGRGAVAGAAERGVLGRAGVAAAENAAGGAAQAGATDVLTQQAQIDMGERNQLDVSSIIDEALTGGSVGAAIAAPVGAVAGGRSRPHVDQGVPGRATAPAPKPVEADLGNPASAPVGSERAYPKKKAGQSPSEPTAEAAPSLTDVAPDVAAAISEKVAPKSPDVAPVKETVEAEVVSPERPQVGEVVAEPPEPTVPRPTPEAATELPPEVTARTAPDEGVVRQPTESQTVPDEISSTKSTQGRVLTSQTPEAQKNLVAQNEAVTKNLNAINTPEVTTPAAPKRSHKGKAADAKKAKDAGLAKQVFDQVIAPSDHKFPTTVGERLKLTEQLRKIATGVKELGINIKSKVGYESTSDHIVYLKELQDVLKILDKKKNYSKEDWTRVANFLADEKAAKQGDFTMLRTRRAEEGNAKKKVMADVENKSDAGAATGMEMARSAEDEVIGRQEGEIERDVTAEGRERKQVVVKGEAYTTPKAPREPVVVKSKREALKEVIAKKKAPKADSLVETIKNRKQIVEKVTSKVTEAQKEAGNYKKEHRHVGGLDISIETKKGQKRSGTAPNGGKWEVTMPHDYGYVKRTTGHDGDNVDVHLGPHAKTGEVEQHPVYVIHQQDLGTGKFDEHKAMLGFPDQVSAMEAYDKGFSDNRGMERVQRIEDMPFHEFKHAMENGGLPKPAEAPLAHESKAPITGGKAPVRPMFTTTVGEVIKAMHPEAHDIAGVANPMARFLRQQIAKKVKDVPVHIVDPADMAKFRGEGKAADGLYVRKDGEKILLSNALEDHSNFAHVALHEAVHAATARAIDSSRDHLNAIHEVMDEVRGHMFLEGIDSNDVYGMSNAHEFVAESMSNPDFQTWLADKVLSERTAKMLGLGDKGAPTLWDFFVATVRRVLGLPKGSYSALEGALKITESIVTGRRGKWEGDVHNAPSNFAHDGSLALIKDVKDVLRRAEREVQDHAPRLLKLRTFDNIAQAADNFFGGADNNPVRVIQGLVEKTRVDAMRHLQKAEPIIARGVELERKYGEKYQQFAKFAHETTVWGVFPDRPLDKQPHLGKNRLDTVAAKSRHTELTKQYNALPEDLKQFYQDAVKHYTKEQNEMTLGNIKNRLLKALGVDDAGLAQRIFENTTTDADSKLLGPTLDLIKEAKVFSKIQGPYFPLIRRGDYIVRGHEELTVPARARKIADNTIGFDNRKDAEAYAKKLAQDGIYNEIESAWVDKNNPTSKYFIDPANGEEVKVTPQDNDAVQHFWVRAENEFMEMFENEADARERHSELSKAGLKMKGTEIKRWHPDRGSADMVSSQLQTLANSLERRSGYRDFTDQMKREFMQGLNETAARLMASTRIQSHRLPRRNVKGYSNDFTKNMYEYSVSTAHYKAKLDNSPKMEAALKKMNEMVGDDATKEQSLSRSAIANEVNQRVFDTNSFQGMGMLEKGTLAPIAHRLMLTSFLDKLASPSASIINATQPIMTTMPVLAGRHGIGRAFTQLGRAYNDIGGVGLVKAGLKETGRKLKGGPETHNYAEDVKSKLKNADERAAIDFWVDHGALDPDAGLEIAQGIHQKAGIGGRIDQALGYLGGIARQVPRAVETINRTATGLAAYRLEIQRGASHEKALQYSLDTINNTQFNYSNTNAAKLFNHPLAKLALQFKKYGVGMYQLLGMQVSKAIRNANPGDRAEALRTLAMIGGTHLAVVGALGLPTEPLKYFVMGAHALGFTDLSWDDIENYVRKGAGDVLGAQGGEYFSRGLVRATGLDISTRMGLDSFAGFGEPKTYTKGDVKAWMWDTVAGAPGSLVADWLSGANMLAAGEFGQAAEKLVPIKFAADSLRAYRQATEGKKSASGRQLTPPYTPAQAAMRVLGFTPAVEAEQGEKYRAFKLESDRNQAKRSELIAAWVKATNKDAAWKAIREFNRSQPGKNKIQVKDLHSAQTRVKKSSKGGIQTTRRSEHILRRLDEVYQ